MATVNVLADQLRSVIELLLQAVDTPADVAEVVAAHLVNAQLAGYDSHGPVQIPGYLRQVEDGDIVPGARPFVAGGRGAVRRVDGNRGWGHYAAQYAMAAAITAARTHGLGAVALGNCAHIGRLGEYAEQAVRDGVIGVVTFGEGQPGRYLAVPFGSRVGALSTNPIAAGVPGSGDQGFLMDFATTTIANARTWVYRDQGLPLPDGVALNRHGEPTTDPAEYLDGGRLVIFGAHKGYALSILTCLLGALSGDVDAASGYLGGAFFLALDPSAITDGTAFTAGVSSLLTGLRNLPPAACHDAVLVPGDVEAATRTRRLSEGIPVSDAVRQALIEQCLRLGVRQEVL